jgi:two-component system, OmpR family, phosphate regulon response regulator PhoB
MYPVLIASSDADFYLLLSHILSEADFAVTLASSVEEILHFSSELNVLAILLDCRPGDSMALEACLRLKADGAAFGIITVALIGPGAEHLHIDLIKSGIDETFVRPMEPKKLISFLQNITGKSSSTQLVRSGEVTLPSREIVMDLRAHRVTRLGREVHLGPIEFRLLRHLIEHAGQVVSRQALIAAGWDEGRYVDTRTINVHIGRLRRALDDGKGDIIRSVRSAGYLLEDKPANPPKRATN